MSVGYRVVIIQVEKATLYRGHFVFNGIRFEYEMRFAEPIPELRKSAALLRPECLGCIFQLSISRAGQVFDLTISELCFFLNFLVLRVIEFYELTETRAIQEGVVGEGAEGGPAQTEETGTINVSGSLREMFRGPNFCCVLT